MGSALLQLSVSDAVSSPCNMENLKNQFTKNLNRSSIKALQLMFYEKTLHHFFDKRKIVLHCIHDYIYLNNIYFKLDNTKNFAHYIVCPIFKAV